MPLYLRDDDVDALPAKVQAATGAPTKIEAVRRALEHELARALASKGFDARNAELLAKADAFGRPDPDFDMKAFTDQLWGE